MNKFVVEDINLWEDIYHKAALRETDVELVRGLYEQRIKELEQEIKKLLNNTKD